MRKLTFILGIALTMLAVSCEKTDPDGLWDPIKTDRSMVIMPKAGGRDTIRLLNYSSWWMDQVDVRVNDTTVHHYPDFEGDVHSMQGEWFSLTIPKEHRNLLVIELQENSRPDWPRELNIGVTVGDAFSSVRVLQDAAE